MLLSLQEGDIPAYETLDGRYVDSYWRQRMELDLLMWSRR